MDIASISTTLSQSKVKEDVSILVLDKAMDVAKQNGQSINQLIAETGENSVESNLGRVIDKYV